MQSLNGNFRSLSSCLPILMNKTTTVGWGELDCPSIMTGSDIRPCHTASMGWLESYLSSVVCSFEVL